MDRFKVSGEELRQHYSGTATLAQVFADIEREVKDSNKVVCQFIVNGIALQEDDELKFSVIPLNEVHTLEYLSQETHSLVESVLNGWIEALPELINQADKLSAEIRKTGLRHHLRDVKDLVDNCQFLISSIISLKTVLGDTIISGIENWEKAEKKTEKTLSEALSAFEKKDFAQLADVVEYELNQGLQLWLEILENVQSLYTGKPVRTRTRARADSVDRKQLSN